MERDAGPPLEPSRWRGARKEDFLAQECQAAMVNHLQRERQVKSTRAVVNMSGFGEMINLFATMTPEQWIEAAGAKADRTLQQVMRDDSVHANVKRAMPYIQIATKTIPGTPAERKVQREQLHWQFFAHGAAVAFITPNLDTSNDPVLAALALGPGEGPLTGEPTIKLGAPLVRLSDLSTRARKGFEVLTTRARKFIENFLP